MAGLAGNVGSTGKFPAFALVLLLAAGVGGAIGSWSGSRRFDPLLIKRLLAIVLVGMFGRRVNALGVFVGGLLGAAGSACVQNSLSTSSTWQCRLSSGHDALTYRCAGISIRYDLMPK